MAIVSKLTAVLCSTFVVLCTNVTGEGLETIVTRCVVVPRLATPYPACRLFALPPRPIPRLFCPTRFPRVTNTRLATTCNVNLWRHWLRHKRHCSAAEYAVGCQLVIELKFENRRNLSSTDRELRQQTFLSRLRRHFRCVGSLWRISGSVFA